MPGFFSSANQALEHCSAVLINLLAQRLWDYRSESSKRMFKDKPPFCHKYAHKPWPGFICSQINKRNRDLSNFSFVTFRENGRLEWKDPGFPGGQKYFYFLNNHFLLQVVLDNPSNIFFTGQRVEGRVIIIVTIINHHHYWSHCHCHRKLSSSSLLPAVPIRPRYSVFKITTRTLLKKKLQLGRVAISTYRPTFSNNSNIQKVKCDTFAM